MTKKQQLLDEIMFACERLASDPLTKEDKAVLRGFAAARLNQHGRDGYLFRTACDYRRDYISPYFAGADVEIAKYILENNHKKFQKKP